MIFKIGFEKAFDFVRWDYLDDVLKAFGFSDKWRGLKQGDPLSPFLFILIMESLHLSFGKILDADLFKGITINDSLTIFHLFYADDVVFIDKVDSTARLIGCSMFSTPFNYLGVKVGGAMSKLSSWDEVTSKVYSRLSKWKLNTLSIGGRLTLINSVLSSIPLYHMSIFKVPMSVLNLLELIRKNFFNGVDGSNKKMVWISWKKNLASKKKAIYGVHGAFDSFTRIHRRSHWLDILRESTSFINKGINLFAFIWKKVENDEETLFWEELG
nr:RNA-directed DNA polymerase, eukaryota, reverse transcriptase zinc-binding domain protein [Tanacetum cinerariifolium]